MRLKVVGDSLGWILILFSATFILPVVTGLAYREPLDEIFVTFGVPVMITLGLGIFLKSFNSGLNKTYSDSIRDREALAIVGLGWLLIAFVGALPYVFSNTLPNLIDAYFESMSGFTTTGSTLLEPPAGGDYLDKYSHSILLWRALTQWLGGLGIVTFFLAVTFQDIMRIINGQSLIP